MIYFNIPPVVDKSRKYISEAINNHKICGDGEFTQKTVQWFNNEKIKNILLTTSGSGALDMSAILCDIKPGDEVIMPSYTFSSTATAFVLRGAKIVFVDIRPDTMNIDEQKIEDAITERTVAIVPVHYAGVACEMDKIMKIAKEHKLKVIEDAAQGVMSTYKGKKLGTIGDFGCYSFHETKNYSMGEGGAIIVKDSTDFERAEIIREKGTNRKQFLMGQVDKYSWVDVGSSFLPSEINVAYLYAQLEKAQEINDQRLYLWNFYYQHLKDVKNIELPIIPKECVHNAHMFYIKTKNLEERAKLALYLKENGIMSAYHYVPLHSSIAGKKYGRFNGEDIYTTKESERILRLPMYYGLQEKDVEYVCKKIKEFYK